MPMRDMNPQSQPAIGRKPGLRPLDHSYVHLVVIDHIRAIGLKLN
jgi:hypothetical protein